MSRTRRANAATLLLVLTACGLSGADKEAAESLQEALQGEYPGLGGDASCVAEHWVKEIGLSALKDADVIGDNNTVTGNVREVELPPDDAEEAVAGFTGCTDFPELVTGIVTTAFEADEAQSECIADAVTSEAAEAWALSDLQGKVTDNVYIVAGRGCMSTAEENARAVVAIAGGLGKRDGMNREQAQCVAQGIVDRIGVYELTAVNVLTGDQKLVESLDGLPMDETDATLAADATVACVSMEELLSSSMVGAGEEGAGPEVKACFTEAFDEDSFHRYLVHSYMGDTSNALDEEATQQLADCLREVLEP